MVLDGILKNLGMIVSILLLFMELITPKSEDIYCNSKIITKLLKFELKRFTQRSLHWGERDDIRSRNQDTRYHELARRSSPGERI